MIIINHGGQVEPEGEFLQDPLPILNQRETTLQRWVIPQVKVQWKNFGQEEATLEDEDVIYKAYPALFLWVIVNTSDGVPPKKGNM